jgi:NADPH-dependent ferric siderophore reductase
MQEAAAERPRRPRPSPRRIAVARVAELSPRMRRVTFEGTDLATFAWSGPAAHLKLVFPLPGTDVVPDLLPDGPRPATMRTYTPRRFDPSALTLDIDFVLHGEGPASTWASQAKVGQQLVMLGPARGYAVDADAAWYLIAADAPAVPAVETLLEAVPTTTPVTVFLEVEADDEARTLPSSPAARVHWLARDGHDGEVGGKLLDALRGFHWPAGRGGVYVGCEANAMRRMRELILTSSGFEKSQITTRGYWRTGATNHPDHDYGET